MKMEEKTEVKESIETNIVEDWIKEQIDFFNNFTEENKSEFDIRTDSILTIKNELANLKSEYKLKSFNISDKKYNFVYMVYDCYELEPEAIIEKVEKDLAEIGAKEKAKGKVESNLAKLVDYHNIISKRYFDKKKELDSIKNEKKLLEFEIEEKLEEYRKFN